MKKIISIFILLVLIISNNITFAEDNTIYNNYKKNIDKYCLNANFYINEEKGNKYIYKYTKYQKYYPKASELKGDKINTIKQIYRNIQNNIYKCGLISSQINGMQIIQLNADLDKTGIIKTLIKSKLKPQIDRFKKTNKNCKFDNNLKISKKQILDQSTFELCKYEYYLDYLKNYYKDINNSIGNNYTSVGDSIIKIADLMNEKNNELKIEKKHSYEVYPMVFNAYTQYQSYFPIHIALEFLKDNLKEYRDLLYKVISPINQVVYKIINAMSK